MRKNGKKFDNSGKASKLEHTSYHKSFQEESKSRQKESWVNLGVSQGRQNKAKEGLSRRETRGDQGTETSEGNRLLENFRGTFQRSSELKFASPGKNQDQAQGIKKAKERDLAHASRRGGPACWRGRFRIIAFFTLVSFLSQQCLFAQIPASQPEPVQNQEGQYTPVITPEQYEARQKALEAPLEFPESDDHFIKDESPLKPAETNPEAYQTVEEVSDLLREDFAYAALLAKLSEKDLKILLESEVETGLVVINGEIVLFTSGSHDEVRTTETAHDLFKDASLVAHVHPLTEQSEGPSRKDIEIASGEEYVITESGVYVYNRSGIKDRLTFSQFIERVEEAARKRGSSSEVRNLLNQFIADTDALNQAREEGTLFRAGGTVSYNPALSPDNVSTLSGKPDPILTGGSSPNSRLTQVGAEVASIYYDATQAGTWAGVTLNYDNFGTTPYEYADLSSLAKLTFGVTTDADRVYFEIEDADGDRDAFTLINTTTTERIYEINPALISSAVDLARIRFMNFVVRAGYIANGHLTGNLAVHAKGLAPSFVNQSPMVDLNSFSDLIGSPARVKTAGSSPGTSITIIDSQRVDLNYDVNTAGTYSGLGLNYDSFSTTPIESFDMTLNPVMAIGLEGTSPKVRLEIQDSSGRRANLSLEGISPSQESFYKIDFSLLAGELDLAHVAFMNFVVDQNTVGTGLKQGVLNIRYGTFVPDVTPPAVVMTSPVLVNNSNYTLAYTVDGNPQSENAALTEGQNTFHRNFQDPSGNQSSVDFIVTLDTVPPVIQLTSNAITNQTNYALIYTVDGQSRTANFTLTEGPNTLTVTDQDVAGNNTTASFDVTLDTVPPSLDVRSSPLVNDPNYVLEYTVDGVLKTRQEALAEGVNTLTIIEYDLAGNESRATSDVVLDTVAPAVDIVSPVLVNNANYILEYRVDGALKTEALTLVEGANVIPRTERDAAGNETTSTWVVTLDTAAPVIAFRSPTLTNNAGYTLEYFSDGVLKTQVVTLIEGENIIPIFERDPAGNETRVDYKVTLDQVPPQIVFTSQTLTNQPFYVLTYTVDGVSYAENIQLLEGQNSFTRTFTDAAGNQAAQAHIVTLDTVPPDVLLTSTSLTNQPNYQLTYTIDGNAQSETVALAEGGNVVSRTFQDAAGNQSTKDFAITLDTIAPQVLVSSPALVRDPNYTLIYTADGAQKSQVITLSEGANVIPVVEQDAAGNETRLDYTVNLDTITPQIVFQSPSLVNDPNYTLEYSVDGVSKQIPFALNEGLNTLNVLERDPAGNETRTSLDVTLDTIAPQVIFNSPTLVNNSNYELVYEVDGVTKRVSYTLTEGSNTLDVTEQDQAGNKTRSTINVVLDSIPPQIQFTSPVLVNNPNYTLTYTADGNQASKSIVLSEGDNVLNVTETDQAGNTTQDSLTVTLDTIPPQVSLTSGTLTNLANYALTYTVDGQAVTENLALQEGQNTFTRQFQDAAGNQTQTDFVITLDTIPPSLDVRSSLLVNNPNYTLIYTVDGVLKSRPETLVEGTNTLTIVERDLAGNESRATSDVVLDTIPPQITLNSPILVNQPAYTLAYTVDGAQKSENVNLTEGLNVFPRTERDTAGNQTTVNFQVTLDTIPPQVALRSSPLVNDANYLLEYTVDGVLKSRSETLVEGLNTFAIVEHDLAMNETQSTINVVLDTIPPQMVLNSSTLVNDPVYALIYNVDGNTQQENLTLLEGDNTFQRVFMDAAGNMTTVDFRIILDSIPPQIIITSPALTNDPDYTLLYTVDGVQKSEARTLIEGANTIQITKQDAAGNETGVTRDVILDTIPPQVILKSQMLTNQANYILEYELDNTTVGSQKVLQSELLTLAEGLNQIQRTFTDMAGNVTQINFQITLDTKSPTVTLLSGLLVNQPAYTLEFTVDGQLVRENAGLTEGLNVFHRSGQDAAGNQWAADFQIELDTIPPSLVLGSSALTNNPAYALSYTVDGVLNTEAFTLQEGENVFSRTETDPAGNSTTVDFRITLDTIPPQIQFSSPVLVNNSNYVLAYDVDGRQVTKPFTLVEGNNVLSVVERDAAGNETRTSLTVTLDTIPPQVVFTSPALVNNPVYDLVFTVDGVQKSENLSLTEGNNTFTRTETDAAGNSTTASFTVILDTIAPQIIFNSPALTNNPNYQLLFTIDGRQQAESITLAEGANTLTRTAVDSAGNVTTESFQVTLDTVPPQIQFTSAVLTNNSSYVLTYTADGQPMAKNFALIEGNNVLAVAEHDAAGNTTQNSLTVTLDTIAPQIRLTSPALVNLPNYQLVYVADGQQKVEFVTLQEGDNAFTRTERDPAGNETTVTFTVTLDTIPPQIQFTSAILINNPSYTLAYDVDGREVRKSLTLAEGDNVIPVIERDTAGNETRTSLTVTLDTTPPYLAFRSSYLVNDPNYLLEYTVDGVLKSRAYTLSEGSNPITIVERDLAGNEIRDTKYVVLDTVPPQVNFTSPALTNNPVYTFSYEVDGRAVNRSVTLAEGDNSLDVTERDLAGNETKISITVTLDTLPPYLVFRSSYLVNDPNYLLEYTVDGVLKSRAYTLSEGSNPITIVERDLAMNETRSTINVILDTRAPVIGFTSVALTNDPNYVLTYTVDGTLKAETRTLFEGPNRFSVTERDLAGNQTTSTHDVILDTIPPLIQIQSPTRVVDSAPSISYALEYTVDGVLNQESVTLAQGPNLFTRSATDAVGNTRQVTFSVLLESPPPPELAPEPVFLGIFQVKDLDRTTTTAINEEIQSPRSIASSDPASTTVFDFDEHKTRVFSSTGDLLKLITQTGVEVNFALGQVESIIQKDGSVLTNLVFSPEGILISYTRTLPFGVVQTAAGGILKTQRNIDGSIYEFDAFGSVVRIRKPDGSLITVLRTDMTGKLIHYLLETLQGEKLEVEEDRLIRRVEPDGTVRIYDKNGNLLRIEKTTGEIWTDFGYGIDGALVRLTRELQDGTHLIGNETNTDRQVDPFGRLRIFDPHTNFLIQILSDQTREEYIGERKLREITPDGTLVEYNAKGGIQRIVNADGSEIRYLADGRIQVLDAEKKLMQLPGLGQEKASPFSLLLSNGIRAAYAESGVSELTFPNGIKVLNPQFSDAGELTGGLLEHPSGIKETVVNGVTLRRELPDGLVLDFSSDGRLVRILKPDGEEIVVRYDKLTQDENLSIELESKDWKVSLDDEGNIISGSGEPLTELVQNSVLSLVRDSLKDGEITLTDGTRINMEGGNLDNVQLPDGTVLGNLESGVQNATRRLPDGTELLYESGELARILTAEGAEYVRDGSAFQLKSARLADGSVAYFNEAGLDRVELADGRVLRDIDLDAKGGLQHVDFPVERLGNGNYLIAQNGFAYAYDPSGSLIEIAQEDRKFRVTDGRISHLELGKSAISFDEEGGLDSIALSTGEKYRFNHGNLFRVLTKAGNEIIYQGSKISSFVDRSGKKVRLYRNFNTRTQVEEVYVTEEIGEPAHKLGLVPYLLRDLDRRKETLTMETPLADMLDFTSGLGAFNTPPDEAKEWFVNDTERGQVTRLDYRIPDVSTGSWVGLYAKVPNVDISRYEYISIGLKRDSQTGEPKRVKIELKGTGQVFEFDNLTGEWQDFVLPVKGRSGEITEITVLVNEPNPQATGALAGAVLVDHIAFFTPKLDEKPDWQSEIGITAEEISSLYAGASRIPVSSLPVLSPDILRQLAHTPTVLKYDESGKLSDLKFLTAPPKSQLTMDVAPANTDAVVRYGRIRQITDPETGEVFTFSYEFDPLGQEITVISNQNTKEVIKLKAGELIGQTTNSKITTEYERDPEGRIAKSRLLYQGLEIGSFDYKYEEGFTLITDNEGVTRRYDAGGVLRGVINPDKTEYEMVYESGKLKSVNLAAQSLDEGAVRRYAEGKLEAIDFADGSRVSDLLFGEDGSVRDGILETPDGKRYTIENGFPSEVIYPSGTRKAFEAPDYEILGWDGDLLVVKRGENTLKYSQDGKLKQITAPDGRNLFVSEGEFGRAKVTYAEPKTINGERIPVQEILDISATETGIEMTLGGKPLIAPSKGLVFVLVEPGTGKVLDQANFDISKEDEAIRIALFLRMAPRGSFLFGGLSGSLAGFTEMERFLLEKSFERFGLSFPQVQGWTFIGREGAAPGTGIQASGSVTSHTKTEGVLAVDANQLAAGAVGLPASLAGENSIRADELSDGMTPLASLADGKATAYRKNFVDSDPGSGFYRVRPTVDFDIARESDEWVNDFADSLLDLVADRSEVYVYFDGRYPSNWISEVGSIRLKSALVGKGVRVIDADQLAELMRINPQAAVIMAQDIAPDTILGLDQVSTFDAYHITSWLGDLESGGEPLVEKFLKSGGTMVWMHDIPFYYVGLPSGEKIQVGREPQYNILGVRPSAITSRPLPVEIQTVTNDLIGDALRIQLPLEALVGWRKFESALASSPLDAKTALVTELDASGEPLNILRADGSTVTYESGRIRFVRDAGGRDLITYDYTEEGKIAKITYHGTDEEIPEAIEKERESIMKKRNALVSILPEQEEWMIRQIDEEEARIVAIIQQEISRLQAQRYQTITVRSGFLGLSKKKVTVEVPGVAQAIGELQGQLSQVRRESEEARNSVRSQIEEQRLKVEAEAQAGLDGLVNREAELRRAILLSEVMPVLIETYRELVGRDPSVLEIESVIPASEPGSSVFDIVAIRNQLTNSDERRLKLERNERIISLVETLLKSREHDLGAEEITNILEWLRTRNMHMGESAFGPLRELLKSNGIDVPEEQLAAEVIVEDIISGVINPTTEGELMLSLNALDKVAGLHGLETGSYKAAFDALPQGEFIAWINENHYVLVKSIADGKVTYFDRSIGENGSEITMNLEEFRAIYSGVILSAEEYQQSDRLTERETQAIKGSFFGIDDLIFAMVIGVIIGAVTGTVISAIQGGSIWKGALIGGIAGLVGGFTAGLGSMFSSVPALFGSQALGNAVAAIGTYASAVSLGSFAGQLTAGFLGEYGLANVLGTVSQISGIIGLASTATLGIANIFQGGFQAGLANIWDGIKSIGGKIWNGITTVASTIGNLAKGFGNLLTGIKDFAFNALPNLKGNLLSNLIEFGKNTFSVIGQGVVKGVEWLGGKFGGLFGKVLGSGSPNSIISLDTVKSLRSNLVNIAIGNATAKTLDDLGLDPTLARLGTAIATGGLTSPENFLGGSLKNLLLAGSNELALHLDLPPPLAESLNMITGLVSENLIDPKSTNIFDGISKIMPSLFTNGITYLGTEIGLSPTVSTLIAGPLGYGLGSLATDLVTGAKSQDIFSHLSQEFGRGLASAGAKIGITKLYDAIDAPPIVEGAGGLIGSSFLDVLLSGQFGASINTATFADAFLRSTVQITGKLALNTSALYQLATTSDLPGTLSGILGSTLSQQAIETMVNTAGDIGSYIGQKLYEIGTKIYEMNIGELKVKLDLIKKELLIEEAKKIKSINFEDVTSEEDLLRKIKITTLDETPDGIKVLTRSEGGKTTEILFSQSEEELLNARPFDDIRLDSDFLRIRPTAQDRYGNFVSGEVETGLAKWVIEENQLKQQQVKEHVWAENYTLASGGADTAVWIQAGEFYDLSAKGFVENISYSPEMLGFIREAIDLGAEYLDVGGGLASVVFRTGMSQQAKDLLGSYLQFQSQTGKKVAEWTLDYTALVQEPSKVSTYASGVGQMDMHLNWFMNGPADLIHRPLTVALDVITGARSISRGSADFFANRRWWNATQEAGLKIAETLRQSETNFMFTPGVNSSGLTETELIQLREAFGPTTKKIAYGHSAGTEALLNALPYMTDQEKANTIFVFASPRMNREAFIDQIQAAGLKPEQVIVMGSSGDLPHTPVVDAAKIQTNPLGLPVFQFADIIKDGLTLADDTFTGAWRDYSAGGAQAYQYVFLERDETAKQSGGKIKDILDHGSMFNGVLTPHRYNINVNGTVQTNELISKVLTDMANQLDQNSGNDNDQ